VSALALAIDTVVQAEDTKNVLVKFAREVSGELHFKLCDIGSGSCVDLEFRHVGALLHPWTGNLTLPVRNLSPHRSIVDP
jgi:hypothetical protein